MSYKKAGFFKVINARFAMFKFKHHLLNENYDSLIYNRNFYAN